MPMRYVCTCCGHRTLQAHPWYSWELCDVCLFEHVEYTAGALLKAQRAYAEHGVVDPELAKLARPPRPDEARPPWWFAEDQAAEALVPLLHEAFGDQDLAGGVSLEEAEAIDDYALPSRTQHDPPPQGYGHSGPWHALTNDDLHEVPWCNFPFQDVRGLRYHIPAYIRHFLTEPYATRIEEDWLLFTLRGHHRLDALLALLTDAQGHAVARWLAHLAADPATTLCDDARKALETHWGVHLDPDQLRNLFGDPECPTPTEA